MRVFYTIILWTFCVLFGVFIPHQTNAQTLTPVLLEAPKAIADIRQIRREPDQESLKIVDERLDPALRPVSIRWRGFEIYPLLKTSQTIDSNIFATEGNETSDFITVVNPSLFIQKEYGRHNFSYLIEGDVQKYWDNSDEDNQNFNTKFNGVLEARRELSFPFEIGYAIGHEKRAQNFSTNFAKEPIRFKTFNKAFGVSYDPNRLGLSLVGRHDTIRFDDSENTVGQAVIRSDADRDVTELEARASYDILPNHRPFVSLTYTDTDYLKKDFQNGALSGPERDSKSIGALAGWELIYKGLVEGYLGAGFSRRNYDSNAIKDVSSAKLAANIAWNFNKKATLTLGVRRSIAEDNEVLSGIVLTQGRLELDYEFMHNLFFNAFADKALADFSQSTREDDILSLGTGLRYILNPRYSVSGHYDFQERASNAPGLDYDRHQVMIRFNARL